MITAAGITQILNVTLGSIFILIVGFFIMEFVLAAISLATGFDSSKKSYEAAIKQLTGALKGLGLALISYFLLNTILRVFGINTETETITTVIGKNLSDLFTCLRDFAKCDVGGTGTITPSP